MEEDENQDTSTSCRSNSIEKKTENVCLIEKNKNDNMNNDDENALDSFPMMKLLLEEDDDTKEKEIDDPIDLLQEIFPNESIEELKQMHTNRIAKQEEEEEQQQQQEAKKKNKKIWDYERFQDTILSFDEKVNDDDNHYQTNKEENSNKECLTTAGQQDNSMDDQMKDDENQNINLKGIVGGELGWKDLIPKVELPNDFLIIPKDYAIQISHPSSGFSVWNRIQDLQDSVTKYFCTQNMDQHQLEFHQHLSQPQHTTNENIDQEKDECTPFQDFSKVLYREPSVGLGITLLEYREFIFVQALTSRDGTEVYSETNYNAIIVEKNNNNVQLLGPGGREGILPNDCLLGMNGIPFHPKQTMFHTGTDDKLSFLQKVGSLLKNTSDPIVLHVRRYCNSHLNSTSSTMKKHVNVELMNVNFDPNISLTSSVTKQSIISNHISLPPSSLLDDEESLVIKEAFPTNHPLSIALSKRQLITSKQDEKKIMILLHQFQERTKQWELTTQLRISASKPHKLRSQIEPHHQIIPDFSSPVDDKYHPTDLQYSALVTSSLDNNHKANRNNIMNNEATNGSDPIAGHDSASVHSTESSAVHSIISQSTTLSTPTGRHGIEPSLIKSFFRKSSTPKKLSNDIVINMLPVRKGLCLRILNSFLDQNQIAYTVWVLDIESGKEWYAPIRYYQDFKDLRSATMQFAESVSQIPFPTDRWFNEKSDSGNTREQRCIQLENFIRSLAGFVYSGPLHPNIVEVSIHLQSFLGCDTCIGDKDVFLSLHDQVATINRNFELHDYEQRDDELERLKVNLKRSFQLYVYRIFLLPIFERFVGQFISNAKSRTLSIEQMRILDMQSRTALKDQIQLNTEKIRDFVDQLTDLLCEGCNDDLIAIAKSPNYAVLNDEKKVGNVAVFLDSFIRTSIREQVETQVYVPLRSYISKQLVNGCRHDDMEINFKLQALKDRTQSFFNIPHHHQSTSNWKNAVVILKEGVGTSTLPITKLNAIVHAAKEIALIHEREHKVDSVCQNGNGDDQTKSNDSGDYSSLGADDFLPIFIYCIVQAEIERPCALCILLRTLCDPSMQIGEAGYYLASFEASIAHIKDIDLLSEMDQ